MRDSEGQADGLTIGLAGRFFGEMLVLSAIDLVAWRWLDNYDVQEWLWEMWRFVKQIFPRPRVWFPSLNKNQEADRGQTGDL